MNRILRFIYAALIVSTAVACHTSEIDDPNNDNPDKPKITDNIQITASIKQTRVSYSVNNAGNELEQRWMVGDVIYGFYGTDIANEAKKIVFTVASVDEKTGVASLDPGDGWGGFLSDFKIVGDNLEIGLVYTGCTTTDLSTLFKSDSTIEVDMANQGTERIPACMHADSFSTRTEDDVTYVIFEFQNDCSILEVFGITGAQDKDVWIYFNDGEATLESLQVPITYGTGEYYLDGSELKFRGINSGTNTTTVSLGGSWAVTTEGDITYDGNIKPVFIAVVPYTSDNLQVTVTTLADSFPLSTDEYYNVTFWGGNSYYIMANPVVARTVDGVYFKTVSKAFEHASAISSEHPTDNTVTLVKDEIYGLVDHTGSNPIVEHIDINYPVTLDLNGCWLDLGSINEDGGYDDIEVSEYFYVKNGGNFTITDSNDDEDLLGGIWSDGNSAASIITNEAGGTVIIENGNIYQYGTGECDVEAEIENPVILENRGSLSVNGGNLSNDVGIAIDSYEDSDTTIGTESGEGPDIDSEDISISIHSDDTDEAIFEMKGGSVSGDVVAVMLYGCKVIGKVSGGNITASASGSTALLVQNYSTCIIYEGNITNTKIGVSDDSYAVHLAENAECIIEGGIIDGKSYSYSVYSEDSKCSIYGGTIKGDPNNGGTPKTDNAGRPTIYCSTTKTSPETKYSFDMSGGSVEGNGLKLFLDKNVEGSITGGNIQTTANRAIQLSGAILHIDGRYNTIDISNGNTQAVGSVFSTILIGDGSNCTISGEKATISNNANGYAVEIKDSECMLSGGTIKTASFIHPAVYCYRSEDSSEGRTTPDLTIQWAEGSSESDSLREGPLIVCTYVPDDPTYIPSYLGAVSTKKIVVYADENDEVGTTRPNYARVDISGGYLYANDGAFYSQSQEGSLSITGSFYTNLGSLESPIKSPYFDFTQECLKYVSSEIVDVDYGDYNFDHKIIPGGEPDELDGGLTIEGYKNGWGSSN